MHYLGQTEFVSWAFLLGHTNSPTKPSKPTIPIPIPSPLTNPMRSSSAHSPKQRSIPRREREEESVGKKMGWKKFDPWSVFFRREWNRNWPFLVGFAVTGALITKMSLGLTEEDAKNSKFVQRHKRVCELVVVVGTEEVDGSAGGFLVSGHE
ncbi:ATP synthase small subunit 6, mitochondrial-like protein [Drosera capensis]